MFASTARIQASRLTPAKVAWWRSTRVVDEDVGVWTGHKDRRSVYIGCDVSSNGCDFYAALPADILSGGFEGIPAPCIDDQFHTFMGQRNSDALPETLRCCADDSLLST